MQRPSWKTIYDRFETVVPENTALDALNTAALGIVEERTEKSILLDDVVQKTDDFAEARRAARNERKIQKAV